MTGRAATTGAGAVVAALALFVTAVAAALGAHPTGGATNPAAVADIPTPMLTLYQRAAGTCPGLDWAVLAAVGKIETDHGRSTLPGVHTGENYAGAGGPMQFLAPTFAAVTAAHPPPPGGATPASRYNPHDAVHAAAAYLCDSGARRTPNRPAGDIDAALFTYNHSRAYVADVLTQADHYRDASAASPAAPARAANTYPAAGAGQVALSYARGQLGLPYLWGGDGPDSGDTGFDCSGLTTAAWAAAGVTLPRTAQTQYQALAPIPVKQARAGDLFFFGTPTRVHHVGIATGHGTAMIHAPDRGSTVRIGDARALPDLLTAAHPT